MTHQTARTIGTAAFAALVATGAMVVFRPEWIVTWLAGRTPDVLYYVDTERLVVALTIDDGPDPACTPQILDVLKQHDAHATFFLIGNRIAGNEDLVQRTVREGHEVANHLSTNRPSISLESAEFERQLLATHRVLTQFGEVRWFRPGSGWFNGQMLATVHEHGYHLALGSIYPFDPQVPSSWLMSRYVLQNVRPGSIIVLHDCRLRGERTAEALAVILPELRRRGYRVVTLSELVDSS
jgi:peptidoglycan/xylan/chitin deacetylase (PgdA/CDA1 family)